MTQRYYAEKHMLVRISMWHIYVTHLFSQIWHLQKSYQQQKKNDLVNIYLNHSYEIKSDAIISFYFNTLKTHSKTSNILVMRVFGRNIYSLN